ncbi:hypothetical protein SASPL_108543 [Salvia splendens]|uniref:Uncharacterized protein n=1 Tax=Salvia splendens TaxID=180675 RepID=A0A8X8YEY0_SALSN|nr:hypothetical protein SASPL_108543 [Salvia splendens]
MVPKSCRIRGLPTISEDSETPEMIEDLRPLEIDHKIGFKEVIDGIQRFYQSYTNEMRKRDILNYRASHAASCFLQLKETKPFTAGKTRADFGLPRFLAGKGRRDLEVVTSENQQFVSFPSSTSKVRSPYLSEKLAIRPRYGERP